MIPILKKIKIYLVDAYYLVFRSPAITELRLQQFEKDGTEIQNTRLDQHFRSYAALKKRHRKIRLFFISLIPAIIVTLIAVFVLIMFILNLLFSTLGFRNNPFRMEVIFEQIMNYSKNIF